MRDKMETVLFMAWIIIFAVSTSDMGWLAQTGALIGFFGYGLHQNKIGGDNAKRRLTATMKNFVAAYSMANDGKTTVNLDAMD